MANQNADVVLNLTPHELQVLSAIFTFDEDKEGEEGETWKQELADTGLNGLDDEDMDVTDSEDIVDQLAAKITHLASLLSPGG